MVTRRKGFTAKQSKRTSRHMNDSMVGSHVQRGAHSSGRHRNADTVSFSNSRAANRARRGEVGTIAPNTSSGESQAAYRQRTRQRRQVVQYQRRSNRRRIFVGILAALLVVAVAVGAGYLAFRSTLGSELSLKDSNAADALVAPKADEPYYLLIQADLGATAVPLDHMGPNVVILGRVDNANKSLALINIPADLQVSVGDGSVCHLYETAASGDAGVVSAVARYAGVDISHFVKIDEKGLVGLVDAFGGVEVDVSQVVDDPHAGDIYIPSGTQTLDGKSAVVYLRAENLRQGVQDKMTNQLDFAKRIIRAMYSGGNGLDFAAHVDTASSHIQTDFTFADLSQSEAWLSDPSANVQCVNLPGYHTATSGIVKNEESYYIGSSKNMTAIVEALENGEDPDVQNSSQASSVDSSSITVEVQNGTDIAGAASVTADILRQNGFKVENVGNAEQQIYTETLVVYKDDGEAKAKAVINALGVGRAVSASYYYQFNDDVLVILGSDYKPVS